MLVGIFCMVAGVMRDVGYFGIMARTNSGF